MFQSQIAFPIAICLTGDLSDETYSFWKAPFAGEVIDLWAIPGATITAGAGTGVKVTLQNGGQVGTATTAIGTIGSGTADTGWVVDTIKAGSVGVATFVAGDVLAFNYDETGTVNTAWLTLGVNVRYGTS